MPRMRSENPRSMAMITDRRKFLKLLAFSALAGSALASFAAKASDAVRRIFPGRIKPLDNAQISKPGPWAG